VQKGMTGTGLHAGNFLIRLISLHTFLIVHRWQLCATLCSGNLQVTFPLSLNTFFPAAVSCYNHALAAEDS
jgi:hypothetical protein